MPRTDAPSGYRLVYRKIWSNVKFNTCTLAEQRTYLGLVTIADDYGRLELEPYQLGCQIWPGAEHAQHQQNVGQYLQKLSSVGLVVFYKSTSRFYMFLPGFEYHQHLTRRRKSEIPDPSSNGSQSLSEEELDKIGQGWTEFANFGTTKHNITQTEQNRLGAAQVGAATVLEQVDSLYAQVPNPELCRQYNRDCYASAAQIKSGQPPSPNKHLSLMQELVAIYQGERAYNRQPIERPREKDWEYALRQTIKTCTLPPFTDRPPFHSCLRKILLGCQDKRTKQQRLPGDSRDLLLAGAHEPNKQPAKMENWTEEDERKLAEETGL